MAKYDETVKARAVEMIKQGNALAEVARQLGPNPKAILRYCKKAGIVVPKKEKVEKVAKTKKSKD